MENCCLVEQSPSKFEGCIITDTAEADGRTKKSVRDKLSNKIQDLTNMPNLTKKRTERKEHILARYGPGKVFGHCPYSVKEMKDYQPYTIKCVSLVAEVLRISGLEFEKILLTSQQVRDSFKQSALDDIMCLSE